MANPRRSEVKAPDEAMQPASRHAYWAGIILTYTSGAIFLFTALRLYLAKRDTSHVLQEFYPELILLGMALLAVVLGSSLLRSASEGVSVPAPVINPAEWDELGPQVVSGKEEAITQYVRLRSLTGFTGVFTKLGLTGLPLATIGLTILFSALAFADHDFMDLAKLTLGAFIGSFVQKQVGERQATSQVLELTPDNKLKVKSSPQSIV